MIVDLQRFINQEQPYWDELRRKLDKIDRAIGEGVDLDEVMRFHYLYERASTDLAKLAAYPSEPGIRQYLESLIARAYAEIHETRRKPHRLSPLSWFFITFPQAFRRRIMAFMISVIITFVGCGFGAVALRIDPDSKGILLPFSHLQSSPADRVEWEESRDKDRLVGHKTSFSAMLMTHNTKVSIFTLALGMTWGIGTIILLFYNGVILGAVCCDYVFAEQTRFLAGWLLPHGVVEIPAILIAGQAGLVLAKALIGWGTSEPVRERLRVVRDDLVTLIFGVAILLVWAGIIEAFFSQYHEPALPYWLKISFGLVELVVLIFFLSMSGRKQETDIRDIQ